MTPEEFQRAEELFHRLADLPPDEREAALEGEDSEVSAEVRRLLEAEDAWGDQSFLGGEVEELLREPVTASEGDLVGPFRLGACLGEGGMGVVFEAEQLEPVRRTVALKLIKWGMDTRAVLSRFRAERQALALMNHPGIARVYDVGATEDGRPYFAMELVEGEPLTTFCDKGRLSVDDRIELFARVCDAVQHAHQRGVIHRDLKPSNILVREIDGTAKPVVIDFGVAKAIRQDAVERSLLTVKHAAVGTPDYMSPEQADSGGADVDTRSDVFSLGVVLYELLVGTRPYPVVEAGPSGWERHRRRLMEEPPNRPSTRAGRADDALRSSLGERGETPHGLSRRLRSDLDWVVLRCLELDRERRYPSAVAVADDLRRHLRHQPVDASPPDPVYRLSKWIQRHRVAFTAASVILIAVLLGGAMATVGMIRARSAEREAVVAQQEAELEAAASAELADFMVGLFEVSNPSQALGNSVTAREILDRGVERIGIELEDQPVLQARLMNTMGIVYFTLGLYPEAEDLIGQAAKMRRTELGSDSPELAISLMAMSRVQRRQADLESASANAIEALRIQELNFGPESPEVAEALRPLAAVERQTGKTNEALEHLERALVITELHFGPDHSETASVLNNLAVASYQAADYARARENLERSLAIFEKEHGSDHPDVGTLLNNLGMIARRQGDNRGAAAYIARDVELSRRILGGDHPELANALRNVGFAEMALGEYESAQSHFDESLAINERAIGTETIPAANAHAALGELAVRRDRLEVAAAEIDRGLAIYDSVGGEEGKQSRVRLLESRARIARLSGNTSEAKRLCREAIRVGEGLRSPEVETARCRLQLAMMALSDGDQAGARTVYEDVAGDLPTDRASFLDNPTDTASRAAFLARAGELDRALELIRLGVAAGRIEAWIAVNPDLEALRAHPGWRDFTDDLTARIDGATVDEERPNG